MKRYLILLLILSFILCSCGAMQVSDGNTDSSAPSTEPAGGRAEPAVEYTALAALPERDMGGATLVITADKASDFSPVGTYMYDGALASRNDAVGKKYNATVAVTERESDKIFTELTAHLSDGTYYSDLVAIPMNKVGKFARAGLIKDLSKLEGVEGGAEYFVQTDAFTDLGKTYAYLCNEMTAGYGYCVFFNVHLAKEKGVDLYAMAAEGTWTWDKFAELVSTMADTGYTYSDEEQMVNAIVCSCGVVFSTLEEGVRKADYAGEFTDGVIALADTVVNNDGYADTEDPAALFEKGGCLFYVAPLYEAEKFATMKDSFGVLPLPTYNGGTDYKTYMSPDTPVLCIPEGTCASENAPYLLQALAAASGKEMTDKYLLYMANFALHSERAVLCARLIEQSSVYDYVYAFGPAHDPVANCTYWATQQAVLLGQRHANLYGAYLAEFNQFVN